jgi:hypothetical protein
MIMMPEETAKWAGDNQPRSPQLLVKPDHQ